MFKNLTVVHVRRAMLMRLFSLITVLSVLVGTIHYADAQTVTGTTLISRNTSTSGNPTDWYSNANSSYSSISAYGHVIAFASEATNLRVPPSDIDNDSYYDIYVYDSTDSQVSLISKINDSNFNGESLFPVASRVEPPTAGGYSYEDGRFIAFQSNAESLALPDTPADNLTTREWDVVLRDRETNRGWRISIPDDEALQPDGNSGNVDQYGDANFMDFHPPAAIYLKVFDEQVRPLVIFESDATNLGVEPDTNGKRDLYLRDTYYGTTELLSRAWSTTESEWVQTNGNSYNPVISEDGRWLAFISTATNLSPLDNNPRPDVYLMDRDADGDEILDEFDDTGAAVKIYLVSRNKDTNEVGNNFSKYVSMSYDGDYLAFQSLASNLVAGDSNSVSDIFVYFRSVGGGTETMERVSVSSWDVNHVSRQADTFSMMPVIMGNGRLVAFTSYANNLIEGDTNLGAVPVTFPGEGVTTHNMPDIYVYDRLAHQVWRASLTNSGQQGSFNSGIPSISGDGRFVSFTSYSGLVGTGAEGTGSMQVFLRDQGNPPGNPNIQPTSWDYGAVSLDDSSPHERLFSMSFLADLDIISMDIQMGAYTDPGEFVLDPDTCTTGVHATSTACGFKATFAPTSIGVKSAVIMLTIDEHPEDPNNALRTLFISLNGLTKGYFLYLPMSANTYPLPVYYRYLPIIQHTVGHLLNSPEQAESPAYP